MTDALSILDRGSLARICTMPESGFGKAFGLDRFMVDQPAPEDYFYYRDNGSRILAVAHLDTVGQAHQRAASFAKSQAGPVVYSRALDDRLGAYIILDMLPTLGINVDVLLTTGEECGRSTAAFFDSDKTYDWMIEFDRGGTDVVMYQYDDDDTRAAVKECGARVGDGIFSDICYLDHLGIKGFNWGVAYYDYHGPKAHAFLAETCSMVDKFQTFHAINEGVHMPHEEVRESASAVLTDDWMRDNERDPFFVGGDESGWASASRYSTRRYSAFRDADDMDLHSWLMRNA